jgi:hypothetical protein
MGRSCAGCDGFFFFFSGGHLTMAIPAGAVCIRRYKREGGGPTENTGMKGLSSRGGAYGYYPIW